MKRIREADDIQQKQTYDSVASNFLSVSHKIHFPFFVIQKRFEMMLNCWCRSLFLKQPNRGKF